jgi:hypothetical protein
MFIDPHESQDPALQGSTMFQAMILDAAHVSLLRSDESLEVDWFYKHYVACIYGTRERPSAVARPSVWHGCCG